MIRHTILSVFAVALLFSNPARAGEPQRPAWKGKVETKNGLTIVSNPKVPLYPTGSILLKEELSVGEAEGGQGTTLVRPWSIIADDDGNMYVMDAGDTCVKVFDERGKYIRSIGRKGQGPGELQYPNSIHLISGRRLIFEDYIHGLNTFTLEGRFLGFLSTAKFMFIGVGVTPENRILAYVNAREGDRSGKEVRLYDGGLKLLRTMLFIPDPPVNPQTLNPYTAGFHMALDRDERAYVAFKEGYEIEVFDLRGNSDRRIIREYDRARITKEDVASASKYARGRKLDVPARHPAIQGLRVDDKGRLYAATLDRTEDGKAVLYDVFDRDGRYLAQVPVPPAARPQDWKNGKLYSLEQDEGGLPIVRRYAVLWRIPD